MFSNTNNDCCRISNKYFGVNLFLDVHSYRQAGRASEKRTNIERRYRSSSKITSMSKRTCFTLSSWEKEMACNALGQICSKFCSRHTTNRKGTVSIDFQ